MHDGVGTFNPTEIIQSSSKIHNALQMKEILMTGLSNIKSSEIAEPGLLPTKIRTRGELMRDLTNRENQRFVNMFEQQVNLGQEREYIRTKPPPEYHCITNSMLPRIVSQSLRNDSMNNTTV